MSSTGKDRPCLRIVWCRSKQLRPRNMNEFKNKAKNVHRRKKLSESKAMSTKAIFTIIYANLHIKALKICTLTKCSMLHA